MVSVAQTTTIGKTFRNQVMVDLILNFRKYALKFETHTPHHPHNNKYNNKNNFKLGLANSDTNQF